MGTHRPCCNEPDAGVNFRTDNLLGDSETVFMDVQLVTPL
jgi:hypothetical protein